MWREWVFLVVLGALRQWRSNLVRKLSIGTIARSVVIHILLSFTDTVLQAHDTPERRDENDGSLLLNTQQKKCFDTVVKALIEGKGGAFFIDAPGGTGKTFLCNLILDFVRYYDGFALATAYTGLASTLLEDGQTLHCNLLFLSHKFYQKKKSKNRKIQKKI